MRKIPFPVHLQYRRKREGLRWEVLLQCGDRYSLENDKKSVDERNGIKGHTIVFQVVLLWLTSPKSDFVPFLKYPAIRFAYFFTVKLRVK